MPRMDFSTPGQADEIRSRSPKLLNFSGGARLVLVTKKEAAELLGVSVDTIERRIKRGELKGHKESLPQGLTWLIEIPQEIIPQGNGGAVPHADAQATPLQPLCMVNSDAWRNW
jgi:excisionase family DNA binding protein